MPKGLLWSAPVAAALVLALAGCGSDNTVTPCPPGQVGTPPNCSVPPPPCTQAAVLTESGPIPARTLVFDDFPLTDTGRLDMTLDWTNASSPMGVYLVAAGTCELAQFNSRTCTFLVQSEPSTIKPRRVSANNLAAGNYRWMVGNFATADESAALQIVLSKGTSCPAVSSLPPSTSAEDSSAALTVGRAERR